MSTILKHFIISLLILTPVAFYLAYAWAYSSPLFYADDFHLLKTIVWAKSDPSLSGKLFFFFDQHNEHRVIIPRLLTWLNYRWNGYINWQGLILFGNLAWVSILFFFSKIQRSFTKDQWMFLPLPFLLLQPQYYDNVTWTISILQQSLIVVWYVIFAFLLSRKYYKSSMLICVLATFTHGNGIFSLPIGIFVIAFIERDWKRASRWLLMFVAVAIVYFWNFFAGQNANFVESLGRPARLVASFLAFFGGISKVFMLNPLYAVATGFCLLLIPVIYNWRAFRRFVTRREELLSSERFFLILFLFLLITAALVCISRSWSGLESILAPRYIHYSSFVLCLCYLMLLKITVPARRKFVAAPMIVLAIIFCALSYFRFHEEVLYRRNLLAADIYNWNHHETFLLYQKSFNNNIRDVYRMAVDQGICRTPEEGFGTPLDTVRRQLDEVKLTDSTFFLSNSGTISAIKLGKVKNNTLPVRDAYVWFLAPDGKSFVYATRRNRNPLWRTLTGHGWYQTGFTSEYYQENLPEGNYRVGLIYDGKFSWIENDYVIRR